MIELRNVHKTIKTHKVLNNINLKINDGELILFKGPNRSGKTMLLRALAGLLIPDSGEIIRDKDYRLGLIIETPHFLESETALYNLKYLASINKIIGQETILDFLKIVDLYDVRNKKVKTFSLGMRQRLAIAQAFMENPNLILLDEPFNAIDDENIEKISEWIINALSLGKIVCIANHGELPKGLVPSQIVHLSNGKIKLIETGEEVSETLDYLPME